MSDAQAAIRIEPSNVRVRVEVDGVTIADSTRPRVLHERGLQPRYYLPREDVRMELLEPTQTVTHCPYKGDAEYYSVRVGESVRPDVVWSYPDTIDASKGIEGFLAFYDEKVDVYLDEAGE